MLGVLLASQVTTRQLANAFYIQSPRLLLENAATRTPLLTL